MSNNPGQTMSSEDAPQPTPGRGMAIAALATGIVGLCVPLLGLVALGLGIVALRRSAGGPRGLAVAGIALGGTGFLVTSCALGMGALLLPALAKARDKARETKSAIQMKVVAMALQARDEQLEMSGGDGNPKAGDNLESLVGSQAAANIWQTPYDDPEAPGYVFVVGAQDDAFNPTAVLLMEDPNLDRWSLNVVCGDASGELLSREEAMTLIRQIEAKGGKLFHTDGRPWTPKDPSSRP